jgi:hypothetical protein
LRRDPGPRVLESPHQIDQNQQKKISSGASFAPRTAFIHRYLISHNSKPQNMVAFHILLFASPESSKRTCHKVGSNSKAFWKHPFASSPRFFEFFMDDRKAQSGHRSN